MRLPARKGVLVVYGKGGKVREVPVHPELRPVLQDWIDARRGWPGAGGERALFLNRRGGPLSRRGASDIFTAIAANAGLDDKTTAHIGRHTFVNELIRGGEDLVWSRRSPGMPVWKPSGSIASPPTTTSTTPCATSPWTADRRSLP